MISHRYFKFGGFKSLRLEIGINESGGAFGSFTLLADEVSPMGRGLLSAEAVGGKVIPSLVVLSLPHELDDFLFPFDLFHLENLLMMSRHDDFVQHRLGVFQPLGEKSLNGMLEVFPMFRLVIVGYFRQSRLAHEYVGINDDGNKRKRTKTNLIVKFVEEPSLVVFR